jgi:Lrp/AsnC family transcriptional regulator, leucine-responsive regulatory protein
MKKLLQNIGCDELDRAILEELQKNGRISNADLARRIHLSQPAVHNRIKRLEKRGVIDQYVTLLDRELVGYDLMCFLYLDIHEHTKTQWDDFRRDVEDMSEVLECYQVTGEYDVMLKAVMPNRANLDRFIHDTLESLPWVRRIKADIVIQEIKSSTAIALD